MPGSKAARLQTNMRASDFRIEDTEKLDQILVDLCDMVVQGQRDDPDYYGVVASAVLDPDNRLVQALNHRQGRKDVHGERAAMNLYESKYGQIPSGSIVITTCSPCTEPMPERVGESCQDLISSSNVHKVYAGYRDPSQQTQAGNKTYHLQITKNKKIQALCKAFADTWLKNQLDELEFLGSPCTKDCSGHRAGYEWSKARAGSKIPNSWSQSFNNGAGLQRAGK
jgi:pyrimidine deaminase RibD-like protein